MLHWNVVQTKPNQERRAQANLTDQGLRTYLPVLRQVTTRRDRTVEERRPLFPGYMFVEGAHSSTRLVTISSTRGVTRVIMAGEEKPAALPNEEIMLLRAREDDDGFVVLDEHQDDGLRRGDRIRVAHGPLYGLAGTVQYTRGTERVRVLLDLLGRRVQTDVAAKALERA
jgi:transcriptional antiterminator RfaH